MVSFERYLFKRRLSFSPASSVKRPDIFFILSAVCHALMLTSPTLPIAWLSEEYMLRAPISCSTSSAAIVSPLILDSANATSSLTEGFRWWQTIIMSRCSSRVLTVNGLVGVVEEGRIFFWPAIFIISGACPPPAPSVWYVWIVLPPIASIVSSTKPHSFNVSVWIATWVSVLSATRNAASIVAGVEPQSSCNFKPQAPAAICSNSAGSMESFPFPSRPKFRGSSSRASSILWIFQGPGVHVVALVPSAGPVPPPIIVVVPLQIASIACCGAMKWMWVSIIPGVHIVCSPAITSVFADIIISIPSITFGLPAFPIPAINPFLIPISALIIPRTGSMIIAFVITRSSASLLVTPFAWPIPSLALLPPPKTISSP